MRHLVSKGPALPWGSSVSYSPAPFINFGPLGKFYSELWPCLPCWEAFGEGSLLGVDVWGVQQQAVSQSAFLELQEAISRLLKGI